MYELIAVVLERKTLKDDLIDVQFMPENCTCAKVASLQNFQEWHTY